MYSFYSTPWQLKLINLVADLFYKKAQFLAYVALNKIIHFITWSEEGIVNVTAIKRGFTQKAQTPLSSIVQIITDLNHCI